MNAVYYDINLFIFLQQRELYLHENNQKSESVYLSLLLISSKL